jgi:Flp pilus assembly protein TadG
LMGGKTGMGIVRDENGTAMTEGAIVVPFFILIWMGLMALHHLFVGRMEAQVTAGAVAMQMADSGECGDADLSLDDISQISGMDTGLEEKEGEMIGSIAGCQPFAWSHATATIQNSVEGVPVPMGGPTAKVEGTRTVMCNMEPVDGLMDLVTTVVSKALGMEDD